MMIGAFVELIRLASSRLPVDVEAALKKAAEFEEQGSRARHIIISLLKNAAVASKSSVPICQDTGTLIFHVDHGPSLSTFDLETVIKNAVVEATKKAYLRPNAVDALTGKNSGNNIGIGSPLLFFHQHKTDTLNATLILKGGGSENMGIQYTLPDSNLGAGRDLEGVRKCVLDAAFRIQGYGCAPGTFGVCLGGDRLSSYMTAKKQFLRHLDDVNTIPELDALEKRLTDEINTLGIGPMGLGGRTTILGIKIGHMHRVPASFFVSISYMCWAFRRCTMKYEDGKVEYCQ